MIETVTTDSSLRTTSPRETLKAIKPFAERCGVTRVANITHLDRIGIPVYVGVRPEAMPGSPSISAGKGIYGETACIGAYMEAIENALAEPGASDVTTIVATGRDVLDGRRQCDSISNLCPLQGVEVDLDKPMLCVEAMDLANRRTVLLPAETVFLASSPLENYESYFGHSTSGLASGNNLMEATLHGLTECIRNDIDSHYRVKPIVHAVNLDSLTDMPGFLIDSILDAGLHVELGHVPNEFDLPHFVTKIRDSESTWGDMEHSGSGCHAHREIAVIRSICQAVQNRILWIYGAHDDFSGNSKSENARGSSSINGILSNGGVSTRFRSTVQYSDLSDYSKSAESIEACTVVLANLLRRKGIDTICRVAFTTETDSAQVVKVVVPKLENFNCTAPRIGKRLMRFAIHG